MDNDTEGTEIELMHGIYPYMDQQTKQEMLSYFLFGYEVTKEEYRKHELIEKLSNIK